MKRKELLVDRDRMYALTEGATGELFLEVVAGGITWENLIIQLTADEEAKFRSHGKSRLDDLASEICKDPLAYKSRSVE